MGEVSPIEILYSGRGWLVIHKPTGMSVHNEPGRDVISLAKAHLESAAELAAATGWTPNFAPAPVHRLDRETSGLMVLALDAKMATTLQRAFQPDVDRPRGIKKIYRAVVRGRPADSGEWTQDLTDRAEGRDKPAGAPSSRKTCKTLFKRLESGEFSSLIEVELATGRQHQIRRHAVLNRHLILGDTRYGEPRVARQLEKLYPWPLRLYLHAFRLEWPEGLLADAPRVMEAPQPVCFEEVLKPPPIT